MWTAFLLSPYIKQERRKERRRKVTDRPVYASSARKHREDRATKVRPQARIESVL